MLFTGDPVFGARDNHIEYGGKGLKGSNKGDGKGKSNRHCSAKFEKSMVPRASAKGSVLSDGGVSDGASQDGECKKGVKSGRDKKKIISVSSIPTSSDAGSVAGCGKDKDTSRDDDDDVDNDVCFPNNKLGNLCWYLDKGRGETRCYVCHCTCCALSKDLINLLVDHGEIEPDQQV